MDGRVEPIDAYLVNLALSLILCSGLQRQGPCRIRVALPDHVMCVQYRRVVYARTTFMQWRNKNGFQLVYYQLRASILI